MRERVCERANNVNLHTKDSVRAQECTQTEGAAAVITRYKTNVWEHKTGVLNRSKKEG